MLLVLNTLFDAPLSHLMILLRKAGVKKPMCFCRAVLSICCFSVCKYLRQP